MARSPESARARHPGADNFDPRRPPRGAVLCVFSTVRDDTIRDVNISGETRAHCVRVNQPPRCKEET